MRANDVELATVTWAGSTRNAVDEGRSRCARPGKTVDCHAGLGKGLERGRAASLGNSSALKHAAAARLAIYEGLAFAVIDLASFAERTTGSVVSD